MPRPIRLLVVNPSPVRGGAEELLEQLILRLPEHGVDPLVACLADGPFVDDLRRAGARVRVLPAGRLRNALRWQRTVRRLAALAREADVVLSWQVKGHYYGTPAARLARTPVAWWDHGIRPRRGESRYLVDARLPGAVRADLVICSSRAAASRHPNGLTIHPGIPLDAAPVPRDEARAALGLGDGERAVAVVGRLQPWKGQDVFLRAAALLAPEAPDARFLLVGGTPGGFSAGYPAELQALAASLGIEARTRFLGHRDDVPALLPGLDVVVNASFGEPFGISTIEAMAAGVPVVATAAGGSVEIVEDGSTGALVPPGDPSAMARAIASLLGDPTHAASLAEKAREAVRERFSIERCAADVAAVVVGLAEGTLS